MIKIIRVAAVLPDEVVRVEGPRTRRRPTEAVDNRSIACWPSSRASRSALYVAIPERIGGSGENQAIRNFSLSRSVGSPQS